MKPKYGLSWFLVPITAGAMVATWGGWAKLATMTGYTKVEMISGADWSSMNIGVTLPITVEPFGALAAAVAFNAKVRPWARIIAGMMATAALMMAGVCQAVVHNLTVAGKTAAPDYIVSVTAVLPVIVLGLSGALAMLNAARRPDSEMSQRPTGTGFLGRLKEAAGDAVASQVERLAETSRASRDVAAEMSQRRPQLPIPTSPAPAGMDVPAGQAVARRPSAPPLPSQPAASQPGAVAAEKNPETVGRVADLIRDARARGAKDPTATTLASLLGMSRASAGRVALAARELINSATPPEPPRPGGRVDGEAGDAAAEGSNRLNELEGATA